MEVGKSEWFVPVRTSAVTPVYQDLESTSSSEVYSQQQSRRRIGRRIRVPLLTGAMGLFLATQMDSSALKRLLEDELARAEPFNNWHGITPGNVRSFLVEPFAVRTDPDDLETQHRPMWIVLQEYPKPTEGYVIVYDPLTNSWAVAEHVQGGDFKLVVSGPSFAEALNGM